MTETLTPHTMHALKSGDNEIWSTYYGQIRDITTRICRQKGINEADIEDVIQNAAIRFSNNIDAIGRLPNVDQGLTQCAKSAVIDQGRRYKRDELCVGEIRSDDPDEFLSMQQSVLDHNPVEEEVLRRIRMDEIREVLAIPLSRMTLVSREAILLRAKGDLSEKELMIRTGESQQTIKGRLHRGMNILKKHFAEQKTELL